jgi:hypothetical protein
MAIVVYSALVNQVIGKHGGSVFQKLSNTLGVRQHVHNNVSHAKAPSASRVQWARMCNAWQALTPAQRNAWKTNAPSYPSFNRLGNRITWSGWQLFTYIARLHFLIFNSAPATAFPYTPLIYYEFDGYQLFVGAATWTVVLPVALPATYSAAIYISKLYINERNILPSKAVFLLAINGGATTSYNWYLQAISYWGRTPTPYEHFYLVIKTYNTTNNNIMLDESYTVQCNP